MKRKHFNLLLGAVTVALVPAIYFSQEKPEAPKPPVTALKESDVTHILLQHTGDPDVELKREGSTWWLVKPVRARAETLEVNGILDLATREASTSYPLAEVRLAELGLEKPHRRVRLNETVVEFGDVDPIENRRYVRVGDQIHLIQDPPSAALDADYADLVQKHLIPEGAKILEIRLKNLKLTRTDKDGWNVQPGSADKGADATQQLVNAWVGAQAMWKQVSTDTKSADTAVIRTSDEEITFTILDRKDQLVLGRPDLNIRYTVSKALSDTLFTLKVPEKKDDAGPESAEEFSEEAEHDHADH